MKIPFISVVAAFLLYSVIAERNGPTNNLPSRRRLTESSGENQTRHGSGGRTMNLRNENKNNKRKRPPTFEVIGVSRSPKTLKRKFPRIMTPKYPFVPTGRYARSQRSAIRGPRKFYATEFDQARRSFDLSIDPDHLSVPKISEHAVFLEPILREKPKKDIFNYLFDHHFSSDSNDELGPLIGPLDLPEIGKNVYIRLMAPPDKETASHVTVHLVSKEPVESFGNFHEGPDFVHPGKPQSTLHRPNELPTGSSRFFGKSVRNYGFTPSEQEPLGLFGAQNPHHEVPRDVTKNGPPRFGKSPQYLPAQNHHQLPIVHRTADNLIDLPIYPPLSAEKLKHEDNGSDEQYKAYSQMDVSNFEDNQHSASAKHLALGSRNYFTSPTVRQSIRGVVVPEAEVIPNRGETPEPVFIREIKAPDLGSSDTPSAKSKEAIISNNFDQYGSVDLRMGSSSTTPATEEDENAAQPTLAYGSRSKTTFRTSYVFSQDVQPGELDADDPDDRLEMTTLTPSPSETPQE